MQNPADRVDWELREFLDERAFWAALKWLQIGRSIEMYSRWGCCPNAVEGLRSEIMDLRHDYGAILGRRLLDALYGPKVDWSDPLAAASDYALDGMARSFAGRDWRHKQDFHVLWHAGHRHPTT